jgi:hypothetical protein
MDDATASVSLFATFEPLFREIIFGVLSFILLGALELARRHLGLQVSREAKQAVLAASQRAAGAVLNRYGADLRQVMTVTSDNPAVMEAARYVEAQLPKNLKKLGMDGPAVQRLILAEIESRLGTEVPPPVPMSKAEIRATLVELVKQYEGAEE